MHSCLLNSPLLATALERVLAALELCPSRRFCPACPVGIRSGEIKGIHLLTSVATKRQINRAAGAILVRRWATSAGEGNLSPMQAREPTGDLPEAVKARQAWLSLGTGLRLGDGRRRVLRHRIIFELVRDFLRDETRSHQEQTPGRYLTPALLIIDDMGLKPLPKHSAEYLMEVILRRYENRSTLMTSNRPLEERDKLLGGVPAAGAILDRFLDHARIVAFKGRSYRIKDSPLLRDAHRHSAPSSTGAAEGASERSAAALGSLIRLSSDQRHHLAQSHQTAMKSTPRTGWF